MAYNQQAFGVSLGLTINDVEARKSLQNMRRGIHNLEKDIREGSRTLSRQGKYTEMYTMQHEKLTKQVEQLGKMYEFVKKTVDNSIASGNVEQQEIEHWKNVLDKLNTSLNINHNKLEDVSVKMASNAGEMQELNHKHREQIALIDAKSSRMEAEGKRYGALRLGAEKYRATLQKTNKEIRLQRDSLRKLEQAGMKGSSEYINQQVALEKNLANRENIQKDWDKFEKEKPVEYVKIRRDERNVEGNAKQIKGSHKARNAEVEALRTTGDSNTYEEARVSARLKRMKDLSQQIKDEEETLSKRASDSVFGEKVRENIAKMQKEYGKLEDKQRRYSEGLDGLNRKNQKQIALMKSTYQTLELTGQHFKAQLAEAKTLKEQIRMLNDQRKRESVELDAIGKKYGKQSDEYLDQSKKVSSLNRELVGLNKRIQTLDRNTGGAYGKMSKFADYVGQNQNKFEHLGNALNKAGKGLTLLSGGIGYVVADGTKLNFELDKTNQYTKSLLQTSGTESSSEIAKSLKQAQKDNVELSEQYGIAQNDIAKTQQDLVHRGYESNQMLQASKPLVEGAIATGYDLKDVTNNATGAMEAFGLRSKDSKVMFDNTKKSINAMAYASDMSSSSFNDTGLALSYVGPTANQASMSLEDTASAIGQLSLSHQKGERAGTGLRKMLNSLISPTKSGKEEIQKLGIQVNDATGKMRPFSDLMSDFHDKLGQLSQTQQADIEHKIFGTTGQTSAQILINNADALGKFTDKVKQANKNDYIKGLSEQKMKTPIEQINRLKRAWEQFEMSLAGDFAPEISGAIKHLTKFVNDLNNASPKVKKTFEAFAIGVPVLALILTPLGSILRNIKSITGAWNSFSSLFSDKVKTDKQRAELLNSTLQEQNRLLAERKELINGTGTISGEGVGSTNYEKSTGSVNYVKDSAEKEEETLSRVERNSKGSRWSRLKSRFGGVEKTGTRFGKVGEAEELASTGLRSSKFLKGAGKIVKFGGGAIAGVDIATSLLDLIGTNSKNKGDHVGGAVGSLGGTAVGGLVGSLAGPIGTAVGSAVGSTVGEKLGKYLGKNAQKHAEESQPKKDNTKKDKYNQSYHTGLHKDNYKIYDDYTQVDMYQSQLDSLNKHKPKEKDFKTKDAFNRALESYNQQVQEIKNKIDQAYTDIEKRTANHINAVTDLHQEGFTDTLNNLGVSQDEYMQMSSQYYGQRQQELHDNLEKLRKLNEQGGKQDTKAYKDAQAKVAEIMSDGSDKQKDILDKLSKAKGHITDKQASSYIKSAHSAMEAIVKKGGTADQTLDDANQRAQNTYDQTSQVLSLMYHTGKIRHSEYKKRMKKAGEDLANAKADNQTQHDITVGNAQDEYNKVIGYARDKTKDHLKNMDEDTGNVVGEIQKQEDALDALIKKKEKAKFDSDSDYQYLHMHKGDHWWNRVYNHFHNSNVKDRRNAYEQELRNEYSGNTYGDKDYAQQKYDGKPKKLSKSDQKWLKEHGYSSVKAYATGGAIHGTQEALVNENGTESAYDPVHKLFRLFVGGPQIAKLHNGEHVLNAKDTYKLTHGGLGKGKILQGYVDGTGATVPSNSSKFKSYDGLNNFKDNSKEIWKDISDDTKSKVDDTHDYTDKKLDDMKKTSIQHFKDIHQGTTKSTQNLVSDYQRIFGKIPSLTHDSVKGSINQLNNGFRGINSTLNQFGSHKNVLQPIHYAGGTNGAVAKEHDAIVNDARNGNQQEAIIRDDGIFLPKFKDALVHLNAGDAVLNGSQTRDFLNGTGLAHYAGGTGVSDSKLKKLIAHGLKHPNDQLHKDFGSQIKELGSSLQHGTTNAFTNSLNGQMGKWYEGVFNAIQDATGANNSATQFLNYAKDHYWGDKYLLGAGGPDLYDCSSMVQEALKHFGIDVGRTTTAMQSSSALTRLGSDIGKARAGDLVLFGHGDGALGHVGIVNNPARGTMFNETPPRAGITGINDVTSVALDGFYRVNGLGEKAVKNDAMMRFSKRQLGKKRLNWIAKHLGSQGMYNGAIPTGDHASLLKQAGIPESEWSDYDYIISHESNWNPHAVNPTSGSYGLPQALPANKMLSAGADWRTNPVTQLRWQHQYINDRYGSAKNARTYWQGHHNYENGGLITQEQIARVGEHNKPEMILPLTDKFRTVQLAKRAVDFVNRNNSEPSNDSASVQMLSDKFDGLSKDLDKVVSILQVIAQQSNTPVRAYITDRDMFSHINKKQKKENMQSALRRGEPLG